MRHHLLTFRFLALLVALTLLTARVGQFSHEALIGPIQNFFSNKDQIVEHGIKKAPVFCKTKTGAEIYSPAPGAELLHPFLPGLPALQALCSDRAPAGVTPEIFIPPEFFG